MSLIVFFNNALAATALGQSGGRLKGRVAIVTPNKKEPLAGAVITLKNSLNAAQVLQTKSDDEGYYLFSNLAAGDYTLSVEQKGYENFSQKVSVQFEATIDLNIEVKPQALSEEVTVTGDASETAKTESSVPSTLTSDALQNAPLVNERFQDALPLLPGVVRGPNGMLNPKGARSSQSGVLVSSLNVTDPVTGDAAIEIPLEAVETVQVYSNPYSAEYGKFAGAVTAIETRAGTNDWKFVINNVLPRTRKRNGAIRGVEVAQPRVAIGGPIIKDKLFLFQSLEYRYVRTPIWSLPELERDTKLESFDSFTRLDYNLNAANRLTASFSIFPQKFDYYNLNTFNRLDSTVNFHQRGFFAALNEQAATRRGALLQSYLSVKQFDADVFGNSSAPYIITPRENTGGWFDRQGRTSRRYEWLEIYNAPIRKLLGQDHAFKVGLNIAHASFTGSDVSQSVRIVRADGTTSQMISYNGAGTLARDSTELSAFVQDKWTLNRRATFDVGMRYDRDSIAREHNFAPRAGVALLPFADEKTVVRAGAGLFYDKIPLGVGVFDDYQDRVVTSYTRDGVTPLDGPRQFINVIANGRLRNPRSLAWNLDVDHELNNRVLLRLGYEERRTAREFRLDEDFRTLGDSRLILSNDGESNYREFQVLTRYRLQEKRSLFLAYVRSRARGDLNDFNTYFGNFRNPVIRANERGPLPFDAPNRLLFWGDVGLPYDIRVSPVADWRSGFPFSVLDEEQNFVGPRNRGGEFPAFLSFDVQATKGINIPWRGKKYKMRAGFKIFNITNHWNPRDVQNNLAAPDYGVFYNSVPRQFRLKFEFLKF